MTPMYVLKQVLPPWAERTDEEKLKSFDTFRMITHSIRLDAEGAFVLAEVAAVGEAVVLRALRRRAVACEVRATGTVRVCRVEGNLATCQAEEHLRIDTHECDQNLGAPEHLALNVRPYCLLSSLCRFDLSLPEE